MGSSNILKRDILDQTRIALLYANIELTFHSIVCVVAKSCFLIITGLTRRVALLDSHSNSTVNAKFSQLLLYTLAISSWLSPL